MAQTEVFTKPPTAQNPANPQTNALAGFEAEWSVAVDIRRLVANKSARERFTLKLADGTRVVLQSANFEPVEGFIPLGETDIVPDPNLPDSKLSYSWYGQAGPQWLQFTVHRGTVSATLSNFNKRFTVGLDRSAKLVFRRFDPSKFPGDFDQVAPREKQAPKADTGFQFGKPTHAPKLMPEPRFGSINLPAIAKQHRTIDVLVMYTQRSLSSLGSQAALDARITESFDQMNQALRNSGVGSVSLRQVAPTSQSRLLSYDEVNFTPLNPACTLQPDACNWVNHRMWLRTNGTAAGNQVKLARDEAKADLVIMMLSSPDKFGITGVAYIQKFDCANFVQGGESVAGCNRGLNYRDFAFSAVSIELATANIVFAHEVGHQLGMEHNKERAGSSPTYPFSYGYYNCSALRQTIMSKASVFECPTTPFQQMQFSNPYVTFIGSSVPSGDCEAYNALTGEFLSRDTAELYSPTNILADWDFASGFDELPNQSPPGCQ